MSGKTWIGLALALGVTLAGIPRAQASLSAPAAAAPKDDILGLEHIHGAKPLA